MSVFASLPRFSFDVADGDSGAIPDPRLRNLAGYWSERCRDGLVPRRSDIDPLEFPALLPNIILLDRIAAPQGDRFRFRLTGTAVVDFAGRELTGHHLDEVLPPTYFEFVALTHHLAIQRQRPVYASSLYHDKGNFVNALTYRLVMPLRIKGDEPDLIMVCQFWQRRTEDGHWRGDWHSVKPEITVITDLESGSR